MSEKIAYFVLGSEGSGTHCLRNALIEAGCHWKQWHEAHQDNYKFGEIESPFVFRRSLPHAGVWVTSIDYCKMLHEAGFFTHILFCVRDAYATAKSVIRRDKTRTIEQSLANQQEAFRQTGVYLHNLETPNKFTCIVYEAFCLSEGFRKWLFNDRLGLPYPENFEIKYGNLKYYNE